MFASVTIIQITFADNSVDTYNSGSLKSDTRSTQNQNTNTRLMCTHDRSFF